MKAREQISESLGTGVKALDLLTPLGRGASLLVIGPKGCGKRAVAEDAILGQKGSGRWCVKLGARHLVRGCE
jgi:F0F1-type ATP synthase alpha subunit